MAMFADNLENLDMIRTPLKAKNQEFTPALGKRQAIRTMLATPTKRLLTATPRSVLGNKNSQMTPCAFKKPKMTPTTMKLPQMTPKKREFSTQKCDTTLNKFLIYEDKEETSIGDMKRKHYTMDPPERCPWAEKKRLDENTNPELPNLEIVDDYQYKEPLRKKIKPISLEALPIEDVLVFGALDCEYPLPNIPEPPNDQFGDVEACPWALKSYEETDSTSEIELELSSLSDIDVTKETISEISIRCFNDSYQQLYDALSDDELPEIPSTPDLDKQLAELLELSFDNLLL